MAGVFAQYFPNPQERRKDVLTEAIINSAVDMEATLGAVYTIVFMLRNHVRMELALRVVLQQAERRNAIAGLPQEPDDIEVCFTASKFNHAIRDEFDATVWHRK